MPYRRKRPTALGGCHCAVLLTLLWEMSKGLCGYRRNSSISQPDPTPSEPTAPSRFSLIRSSVDAIGYVITRELCHMRFRHHGTEFFQLLDRLMPDWEKCKIKLERQLA
jgi:hypothetical protein